MDGEIAIRGPIVMRGYYNRPDLTAEVMTADGWFKTGDVALINIDKGIIVNEKQCEQYLKKNPSLATLLVPKIGYLEAAKIAKQAQAKNRSVKEIVLEKGLLKPEELEKIFSRKNLLNEH